MTIVRLEGLRQLKNPITSSEWNPQKKNYATACDPLDDWLAKEYIVHGGMKITRGTKVLGGNLTQSHFVHHVT
jgi:hypothetical protein